MANVDGVDENSNNSEISKVLDSIIIEDPHKILLILHKKKQTILHCIFSKGKTIQEIKKDTGINPGTIKRHLDELRHNNLVFIEEKKLNDYNILMKYYRAVAKEFIISLRLS